MRVNTQPGAFVFQAGLTAPPGSLHYDAAPDADGNGDLSRAELTSFFMTLLVVTKGLKDGGVLHKM